MATITDFEAWLDQADPEGHEEVYALYYCVDNEEDFALFECGENNDRLFIKAGHAEDTLMLASPAAKAAFLELITSKYVNDGMDMESWYGYRRAMAKDD